VVKNILYLIGSFAIFLLGIVFYGIFFSRTQESLDSVIRKKNLDAIKNINIIISKSKYELRLFSDTTLLKSYKIVMGRVRNGKKFIYGSTPVGKYKICELINKFKYHKLMKLNYPNSVDAAEMLLDKKISKSVYRKILLAEKNNDCPPNGINSIEQFGIQGIGEFDIIFKNLPFVFNWTNGSVAVSNYEIDELFAVCKIGTEVVIQE